jgi:hypothetical protein
MPEHERFEELCAVAAIGQLSEAELAELAEHLKSCFTCRRTASEFAFLLNGLPIEEGNAEEGNTADVLSSSHRAKFLARACGEGVKFSRMAIEGKAAGRSWWPKLRPLALVGVPALAVIVAAAAPMLLPMLVDQHIETLNITVAPPAVPSGALLSASEPQVNDSRTNVDLFWENEKLRAQLAHAQREESVAQMLAEKASTRAQESDQQLRAARGEMARAVAEADTLRAARDAATTEVVAQQYRLNALNEEIKNQRASAEQDRQLTTVAKDVRELMGARNLHIIDVFDADGSGRPKKSFGRVFYVEGKSLIFYAFDLKQKSSGNTKVSFQAWGQRGDSRDKPKSLGVFYVDDRAQGRWVLKVEDPARLSSMDSVFVTVEPLGGADRPTGQKLLYAFLGSYANHP